MFTNIHLERARKSQCAAARLSYVADAIELHMLMDKLCLKAVEIGQHTAYDDNNHFTYHEIDNVWFDEEKLAAKGGNEYLAFILAKEFEFEAGEHYELADIRDFIDSADFLQDEQVRDLNFDLGDVVRFNSHDEKVCFDGLAEKIIKCLKDDTAALAESLTGLAA